MEDDILKVVEKWKREEGEKERVDGWGVIENRQSIWKASKVGGVFFVE